MMLSSSDEERLSGEESMRWWTVEIDWMSAVSCVIRDLTPSMRDR
jgi:hypothetical protein